MTAGKDRLTLGKTKINDTSERRWRRTMKTEYQTVVLNLRLHDGEQPSAPTPAPAPAASAASAPAQAPAAPAASEPAKQPLIHPRRKALIDAGKIPPPPGYTPQGKNKPAQSNNQADGTTTLPPHDGKQAQPEPTQDVNADRRAKYQELISGEYKDLFSEHVQKIINDRFKNYKTLEEQVGKYKAIVERVATKYGADPNDPDSVLKSVDEDDSYYEEEAMRRGLTVAQLKEVLELERKNAELLRQAQTLRAKQEEEARNARWFKQAEEFKKKVPGFDLIKELENPVTGPTFLKLISDPTISVEHAYRVVHFDEIMSGAMAYTAQQVQQATVNDIKARGMRPIENGVSSHAPAQIAPKSAKELTREDHKRINRLVARGETIDFSF